MDSKDFKDYSFLFSFENAEQMSAFFSETKRCGLFPQRTAVYDFCANKAENENISVIEQNGSVYTVEDNTYEFSSKKFTVDVSGKISSTDSFSDHRQSLDSELVLEFPKVLENVAREFPQSTFCGFIHDTDFEWWETTITYEFKDGVLIINRDGYSEDGDNESRKAEIVINIK